MDKMQTSGCLRQDHIIFMQFVNKFIVQFPERTLRILKCLC